LPDSPESLTVSNVQKVGAIGDGMIEIACKWLIQHFFLAFGEQNALGEDGFNIYSIFD